MKPFYATPDGSVRIYHARWEDVLAAGVFKPRDVALIHADPPYGGGDLAVRRRRSPSDARLTRRRVFAPIVGDEKPFDPGPLLALKRPTVLWGANHYAGAFPSSGASWLLWDKREGMGSDNQSDGELAWTNLGGPLRVFGHHWKGMCRKTERDCGVLHPTQKPEALSAWVFAHAAARKKLRRGDLVLVPYMGSGPDLPAARAMGLRVIACEVDETYCRTAVARLGAAPHPEPAEKLGPLFERGGVS